VIARLNALPRRQRALLIVVGLVALFAAYPAARWVWRTFLRPPIKHWEPLLPYGALRVGIDASYPPFGADPGNGELFGLDVDLARLVAAEMGVPVRFVNMGYDGLYDSLAANQADVLFSALRVDPLRMDAVRYTVSYFDAGQVLVRPPESGLNRMADLEGLALAVEFGAEGDVEARTWQRRLHTLDISAFETAAGALEAVLAGQADAALVDAISARLWLRDHDGLELAPEYVTHDPYAAAVRADNERLWAALNAALTTLIERGAVEEVVNRWL